MEKLVGTIPLSTRELLQDLRSRFMPESLAQTISVASLGEQERQRFIGAAELVAGLIDLFEEEHGKL